MNIKRYELIKKVVDIIKTANPYEIEIGDYTDLEIVFKFKDEKVIEEKQ